MPSGEAPETPIGGAMSEQALAKKYLADMEARKAADMFYNQGISDYVNGRRTTLAALAFIAYDVQNQK